MKHELRVMRDQGSGAIVNCSSLGGLVGLPQRAAYHGTKHAVLGMTKSAGVEYAPRGIRINAVYLGTIDTPMVADMLEGQADAMAEMMKQQSIGRLGRAEEVAAAVLWLCNPAASFVIGVGPAGRRRLHRALRTIPTNMPSSDLTLAAVAGAGLHFRGGLERWKLIGLAHALRPKVRPSGSQGRFASIPSFKHPNRRVYKVQALRLSRVRAPHGIRTPWADFDRHVRVGWVQRWGDSIEEIPPSRRVMGKLLTPAHFPQNGRWLDDRQRMLLPSLVPIREEDTLYGTIAATTNIFLSPNAIGTLVGSLSCISRWETRGPIAGVSTSKNGVASMCDYSLQLVASRPAKVGDELVSTRFVCTTTRGFAAADECDVAVCPLPGTELAFQTELRCGRMLGFGFKRLGHKVARFREINKDQRNVHHDALELPDGQIVLVTKLREGKHATVRQLPASPVATPIKTHEHELLEV